MWFKVTGLNKPHTIRYERFAYKKSSLYNCLVIRFGIYPLGKLTDRQIWLTFCA